MNNTTNVINCCECGRDLSMASNVSYISEGPICTFCFAKLKAIQSPPIEKYNDWDVDVYDVPEEQPDDDT